MADIKKKRKKVRQTFRPHMGALFSAKHVLKTYIKFTVYKQPKRTNKT